ncbi:hypothetical protein M2G38_22155, partial [Vibrio vulnificus]|nr:hypothetical protein [Vibrio vulnificus]
AMGSGNYASAVKTASPTYQLHAIAPDAVQQVGIDYALGATEMLAAGAYNTAVDAVAGLAGLAQLAFGDLEQSSALIQSIQEKYSYVPQSRGAHQIINNVSGYVEAYADTMEGLGSATLEHTGSPLAATLVQLAPEIVMTAWGGRVAMKSVGKGVVPDSKLTPSEFARSLQGAGDYPGKDSYRDIILKKGKIIYGGTPGQSEFYTTVSALKRADYSSEKLFNGVQVAPGDPARIPVHPITGLYRPGVSAYEVVDDVPAAFGRTLANPQHGSGGLPQIVIENYKAYLKPLYSIPLNK